MNSIALWITVTSFIRSIGIILTWERFPIRWQTEMAAFPTGDNRVFAK